MRGIVYIHGIEGRDHREAEKSCIRTALRHGIAVGETLSQTHDDSLTLNDVFLPKRIYDALILPDVRDLMDAALDIAAARQGGRRFDIKVEEIMGIAKSFLEDAERRQMRIIFARENVNASALGVQVLLEQARQIWRESQETWRAEKGRQAREGQEKSGRKGGRPRKPPS